MTFVTWFRDPGRKVGWVREPDVTFLGVVVRRRDTGRYTGILCKFPCKFPTKTGMRHWRIMACDGQAFIGSTLERWVLPKGVHPRDVARRIDAFDAVGAQGAKVLARCHTRKPKASKRRGAAGRRTASAGSARSR